MSQRRGRHFFRQAPSILITLVLLGLSVSFAAPVDITAQFPDTQGQNGFYAQAYNPDTGLFRLLVDTGSYKFETVDQPPYTLPYVSKVAGNITFYPTVGWRTGTVHGTEWAVLSYLVQTSGEYSIAGLFSNGNVYGCTTIAQVFVNNNAASPLFTGNVDKNTQAAFNLTGVSLSAGDYLRFAVDAGTTDLYDHTTLTGTITATSPIPEPASLAALVVGVFGTLVGYRRNR